MTKVEVYGADWCEDTQQARRFLTERGVSYDYINVEQDKQALEWVKQQNGGKEKKPTIKIGAQVLSVPSNRALEEALRDNQILSR